MNIKFYIQYIASFAKLKYVCVPPKIHMLIANFQCDCIWRWAFGRD